MSFQVGDWVLYRTTVGVLMLGQVNRVYETTFGASVRDEALQVELVFPLFERERTTIRSCRAVKAVRPPTLREVKEVKGVRAVSADLRDSLRGVL